MISPYTKPASGLSADAIAGAPLGNFVTFGVRTCSLGFFDEDADEYSTDITDASSIASTGRKKFLKNARAAKASGSFIFLAASSVISNKTNMRFLSSRSVISGCSFTSDIAPCCSRILLAA